MAKRYIPTFKLYEGAEEWPINELVHHEFIEDRCDELAGEIETHRHLDLFHIFYFTKGVARAVLDGVEVEVEAPILATVPPMSVHGFLPLKNVSGHLLTLPGSSVEYLLRHSDDSISLHEKPFVCRGEGPKDFEQLEGFLLEVASEYSARRHSRNLAIQALMRLVFVWIIRRVSSQQEHHDLAVDRSVERVRKFKRLIENSYHDPKNIKDYASELGVSATQLNNICRATVDKSALEIIHDRILLEAKRNLVYTSLSISGKLRCVLAALP